MRAAWTRPRPSLRYLGPVLLVGTLLLVLLVGLAQAAISYVGQQSTSSRGKSNSITVSLPAGVQANDYLVAAVAQVNNGNLSAPSGWTTLITSDGTRNPKLRLFGKVATGSDAASYAFSSDRTDEITAGIVALRGVDTSSPVVASGIQATNGSTSCTAPSISPTVFNTLLLAVWGSQDADLTVPSGMTASLKALSSSNSGAVRLLAAHVAQDSSGATGTRVSAMSASKTCNGALLALRAAGGYSISGTVFEDLNYGGGAGRNRLDSSGTGTSASKVELYDGSGKYIGATSTDSSGRYSFSGLAAGSYHVRVVSATVRSTRPDKGAGAVAVMSFRTDADSGSVKEITDQVGGTDPTAIDPGSGSSGTRFDTSTYVFSAGLKGTAHAVAPVTLSKTDIKGVDFGFNFSTIVNTLDSGQGSLRQFITNATTLGGESSLVQAGNRHLADTLTALTAKVEHSIFMISDGNAKPGMRAGRPKQLLAGGWARISLGSALPEIPASTVVDGATQTANGGDTHKGQVGSGGTVGVSATAMALFDRPEIEISGAQLVTVGGSGAALRAVALRQGRILLSAASTEAADNLVAMGADGTSDASTTTTDGYGITLGAQTGIVVRHNFVRVDNSAIRRDDVGGTATIEDNEVGAPGSGQSLTMDGVILSAGTNDRVRRNLLAGQRGAGYEVPWGGGNGLLFEENTIRGNGMQGGSASSEPAGIVIYGSNGSYAPQLTIRRNLITGNGGPGISVANASRILITQNAIHGNGAGGLTNIGIDLDPLGRDGNTSYPPQGVTANTGTKNAALPNAGMNFPVITAATLAGSVLTVSGHVGTAPGQVAFANSTVEVFASDGAASGQGSGRLYLGSLTANGSGNFSGTLSVDPTQLALGDALVATATDGSGNTSEFSLGFGVTSAVVVPAGFNAFETDTAAAAISGVIRSKVAGTAASLAVVALDATGTALHSGFTGNVSLRWLDARNDSGAFTASCRASWASLGAAGSVSFANNNRVTATLTPPASGTRSMRLQMIYTDGATTVTACSSDAFAALPASLTLAASDADASAAGSTRTLGNAAASGGVVHRAGRPFTLTARALDSTGATMTGYDGTPVPAVVACLLPAGCTAGALTSTATAAAAGIYGNANVSYAEVGVVSLQLSDSSYAAVDAADTAAVARTVTSPTLTVGRFVPDSLVVSVSTPGSLATANAACMASGSGATFIGQGFGWRTPPQVTVTARNAAGDTTSLWTGALMKLVAPAQLPGLAATATGTATLSSSFGALTVADLGTGQARLDASNLDRFMLEMAAGSVQPSVTPAWTWQLAVTDASEAAVAGNPTLTALASQAAVPFDAGAVFHRGRLTLSASHGDARVGLRTLVQLQRWTAAGWVTMTEDRGCVTVQPQHLGVEAPGGVFTSAGDCAAPMSTSATTAGGRSWLSLPAAPGGAAGRLTLRLAGDAASGHSCSAAGTSAGLVSLGLPWLLGGATGSGSSALATWGLPNRDLVLRREIW